MNGSKRKRIEKFVQRLKGLEGEPVLLAGDASERSFYRVSFVRGTAILMVYEEPSPEQEKDYIDVRNLLASCGVGVPEIYDYDPAHGILLVEDFGDLSLQDRLAGVGRVTFRRLYKRAIDEMLLIQIPGSSAGGDCVAFRRAFDEETFIRELDYYLGHTVEGYLDASLSDGERDAVRGGFHFLSSELAALPRALAHRDYHSRNLMVTGDEIKVVDFQDARLGPFQYDLASLLRDSYTVLDSGLRDEMVEYYLGRSAGEGIEWYDAVEFSRRFDLMSVQRNLKACGTFGYMATVKRDRRYLRYIAPTWAYVAAVAPRFPRLHDCIAVLSRYMSLI